jgi:hypothetical protein
MAMEWKHSEDVKKMERESQALLEKAMKTKTIGDDEKYDLQKYQTALERERMHQEAVHSETKKLMEASKQKSEQNEPECPHCKSPVKPSWKACPACGVRLESDTKGEVTNASASDSRPAVNSYFISDSIIGAQRENIKRVNKTNEKESLIKEIDKILEVKPTIYNCDIIHPVRAVKGRKKPCEITHRLYIDTIDHGTKESLKRKEAFKTKKVKFPEESPWLTIEVVEDEDEESIFKFRRKRIEKKLTTKKPTDFKFFFKPVTVWEDGKIETISFRYLYKDVEVKRSKVGITVYENELSMVKALNITLELAQWAHTFVNIATIAIVMAKPS